MVTIYSTKQIRKSEGKEYSILELRGLSTDEKPTELNDNQAVDNGSIFIEIDTGKIFFYDLDSETWKEV